MRYYKKKSYKEIAERLGKSEISVKAILHRAKKTIKDRMKEQYPEMTDRMSKKYIAKMVAFIAVGIVAVSGLAYATYRIYNDVIKKTYTLSEFREELPENASIITKDEALDKINYYLDVLGEENVMVDNVKLINDFRMNKVCWIADVESAYIEIDSKNGNLVIYSDLDGESNPIETDINEVYERLNLPSDYEIYNDNKLTFARLIEYAKKYDDIYNKFESVTIMINKNRIESISVSDYPCEDTEVLISKERALEIAKENKVNVEEINLSIENVGDFENPDEGQEIQEINEYNREEIYVPKIKFIIRKVWKIYSIDNKEYLIDSSTGELIKDKNFTVEEKGE